MQTTHLVLLCVQFFDNLCAVLELLRQLSLLFLGAALCLEKKAQKQTGLLSFRSKKPR